MPMPVFTPMPPAGKILYGSLQWKCLQFLASFFLNVVIARTFRSAITAEFYYLVYWLSLCITLFTMGLDISISYFLPRNAISPVAAGRLILAAVGLALLVCLPLLALLYRPAQFPDLDRSRILVFSALQITGGLLTALSGTLFTAYGRNDLPSKIACILNLALVIGFSITARIQAGTQLVHGLFGAWFLGSFVQGLFLFILADRRYGILRTRPTPVVKDASGSFPTPPAANAASGSFPTFAAADAPSARPSGSHIPLRDILRFSITAFLINFIFFLASRLSLYLIPFRLGPTGQGNYIQAYKLVEYMGLLMSFLYYPVIVLVAGTDIEKMKQYILFLVRLSNTVVLLFSIAILSLGWWAFPAIFGPSFGRVYGIFTGFIPGLFAVCSSGFFTAWYFGSGHIKYNGISAGIQWIAMLAGFFIFPAPRGTALAFSLASLLSLGYDLLVFRRFLRWSPGDILFVRRSDLGTIRHFLRRLPGAAFLQRQQGQV